MRRGYGRTRRGKNDHWILEAQTGNMETGNMERAVKHWRIAASAGCCISMHNLLLSFEDSHISRDAINSILTAYNNSCVEMRSEARNSRIRAVTKTM